MRIVFLDIDGVLKHSLTNFSRDLEPWKDLDKYSCHLVSELCVAARAKIVISSNWRTEFDRGRMQDALGKLGYFLYQGIEPHEWKTDTDGPTRGHEIRRWLCDRCDIDSYVIIDDERPSQFQYLAQRLVSTKTSEGFRHCHYDEAYRLLVS